MAKRGSLIGIGAAVGAAAALVGAGYTWLVRRPLARTRGTLALPGLHQPVEVLRDRWGVPHLYARTLHDLFFAQGFVHAQDRLWQMDFQRRLVSGRLSEILGERTLPVDRWVRTLTMRRVAEREAEQLGAEERDAAQAYAAGVNARIAQRNGLPLEFSLLRYRPEPWTAADSLSWAKMLSWMLSVNWEAEILRARLIAHLGPERAAELQPPAPDNCPPILSPEAAAAALERAHASRRTIGPAPEAGLGSNSWVLAGSRTATGAPLLANDMHLTLLLPSIWYENHLVGGDLKVTGASFPGIPGVVAGHNGHVAWGFTNGFADVQDLFLERLRPVHEAGGPARWQYEFQGEWLEAEVLREEIRVKGAEPVVEEVIVTRHGPIINALAPDLAGEQPLALRWTSLEPESGMKALLAMNRARTCLEFREALRHWVAPVQNVVYADTEGHIAYTLAGRVPIRAKGDGRVPVPGWTGEHDWLGYVPFDELPHLVDPPQGYVATANNRVVDEGYPYELGCDWSTGHRAQRILELIEATPRLALADCQRMQLDQVSPFARVIAGHLGELQVEDPELAAVVALMRDWDGTLSAGSPAAAVHEVFGRRMLTLTLSPRLGDLTPHYTGKGPTPVLAEGSTFGARSLEWLEKVLSEPDSPWFDLGHGEGRDEVMRQALRQTVDFLKAELGPDIEGWAWGKLHTLTYRHTLGAVKPLGLFLNRGPYALGGDGLTLWATGASLHDLGSEDIIGAPYRFVVDLGDVHNSTSLLVPGQSGQPGSPHYDDQIEDWFTGGYHPMLYSRQDVERGAQARLQLLPDS